MHTENPRVLENLIKKHLAPFITEYALEIPEWISYTGVHTAPNNIVLNEEPKTVMRLGDRYRIGYDDTRYFEAEITVPDCFEGRKAYLTIDFGGEALVRINGKIVGAVSSRENCGWVCRNEILFPDGLHAGEKLFIRCENAVDCGGFCDSAMDGAKHMTYTLNTAALRLINEEAESFFYDMTCAWEIYKCSEDRYAAKRLYNAIDNAAHLLCFDLGKEKYYASLPAAAARFREETGKIRYETPGEIIYAGHSHLDIAWLWTVRELNRKTARTFSNNLALMDVYPDFRFTQSQALVYQFMKDRYPDIYERVKEKVASGQWEITGSAWVEADTNIASGESLIRQLLYGRQFFLKEFGVSSDIYWLPDCFGFTAALPQIIAKSGMKYFITSKLQNNDTNEFPLSLYKWRAHSGDEILAYMQKVPYGGDPSADYVVRARSTNRQNDLTDVSFGMYGYGDGGGGCTFDMFEKVRRYASLPGLPKVRPGKAAEFFAEAESSSSGLPVWDGEMYYENHRGTFTSQAFVKKNNRRGEFRMRKAEMLSLLSGSYPAEKLETAWKMLLQNQFHDILPGTSIHEVFEDTRREYEEFNALTDRIIGDAEKLLDSRFGMDNTVLVRNLHTHALTDAVSVAIPFAHAVITDGNGKVMNSIVRKSESGNTVEFTAENVPGMGYRLFCVREGEKPEANKVICTERLLENDYLRARFDENGLLVSLFDKESGRETLTGRGNLLTLSHDKPIHESAWNLESDYKMNMQPLTELISAEVTACDEVRGTIRQVRKVNSSVITQYVTLKACSHTLDFYTEIEWNEREKVLKAEFPVDVRARYSTFEIAHGAIERPTYANNPYERAMFECCAHKWTDLSENGFGVSLLNDCKYGYDISGNVMRITLLRGPVCPDRTGDIGFHSFTYSIYPHAGRWSEAETVNEAFRLNEPLTASYVAKGSGKADEASFLSADGDGIIIDALKKAEDGDGMILRFYEAKGKRENAVITLPEGVTQVAECNMMEADEKERLTVPDGKLRVSVSPYEVRTFRIR